MHRLRCLFRSNPYVLSRQLNLKLPCDIDTKCNRQLFFVFNEFASQSFIPRVGFTLFLEPSEYYLKAVGEQNGAG